MKECLCICNDLPTLRKAKSEEYNDGNKPKQVLVTLKALMRSMSKVKKFKEKF